MTLRPPSLVFDMKSKYAIRNYLSGECTIVPMKPALSTLVGTYNAGAPHAGMPSHMGRYLFPTPTYESGYVVPTSPEAIANQPMGLVIPEPAHRAWIASLLQANKGFWIAAALTSTEEELPIGGNENSLPIYQQSHTASADASGTVRLRWAKSDQHKPSTVLVTASTFAQNTVVHDVDAPGDLLYTLLDNGDPEVYLPLGPQANHLMECITVVTPRDEARVSAGSSGYANCYTLVRRKDPSGSLVASASFIHAENGTATVSMNLTPQVPMHFARTIGGTSLSEGTNYIAYQFMGSYHGIAMGEVSAGIMSRDADELGAMLDEAWSVVDRSARSRGRERKRFIGF